MRLMCGFVSLALLLLLVTPSFAYTLSGDIDGGQWFGGITYVYAFSLDVTQFNFYIGLALLGNGPYLVLNVPEGDYILLAFQDRDGNLIPSIDDYMGYYGGQTPTTVTVTGNMNGLDITVGALPFTTITGLVSCDSGFTGMTTIQAATDPLFENVTNTGILLSLDGNGTYSLFITDPGEYYVRAYLDADFSFSASPGDPQTFWGIPNTPQLVDVTGGSAQNIDLSLLIPPEVSLTLTPPGTPIIIPHSGGSFNYTIGVANNGATAASLKLWMDVTLPNGATYGPILGPMTLNLPAGWSATRNRTQAVPGAAPAGTYSYNAYLGFYPALVWQEESFPFQKSGVDEGGLQSWACSGDDFGGDLMGATLTGSPQPRSFELISVYPNPFNPSTVIRYQIPDARQVSLRVYDTAGRLVTTLVDGWREVGNHEITFDGSNLPSGVYVYRLEAKPPLPGQADGLEASGKMVLMK